MLKDVGALSIGVGADPRSRPAWFWSPRARATTHSTISSSTAERLPRIPCPNQGAPPGVIRWVTGNADPLGRLPWPFGTTDYLVWWATASWPLWLASVPSLAFLLLGRGRRPRAGLPRAGRSRPGRRSRCPASTGSTTIFCRSRAPRSPWRCAPWMRRFRGKDFPAARTEGVPEGPRPGPAAVGGKLFVASVSALVLLTAIGATAVLEVRCYLLVAPEDLTARYKGGRQWVALRQIGRELDRRARIWKDPHLYIWGWQSPLYFYGRMDSPTRHFFVDNLLRDQADRNHRLIGPRTEEILAALKAARPS